MNEQIFFKRVSKSAMSRERAERLEFCTKTKFRVLSLEESMPLLQMETTGFGMERGGYQMMLQLPKFAGKGFKQSPLGSLIEFDSEEFPRWIAKGTNLVRPELLCEQLVVDGRWSRFIELLELRPECIDHIINTTFVCDVVWHWEALVAKARDLARVIAVERAARSAIAEIEAELL